MADSLEKKILGMYGLGMSFRDISKHIKEMYDTDISHSTLSAITDRILLGSILPQSGGKVKMILARSIAAKVEFTPEEISAFELRGEENGFVRWNPARERNLEVSFSPEEVAVLKEAVEGTDQRQVITRQMLPLIEQIESL